MVLVAVTARLVSFRWLGRWRGRWLLLVVALRALQIERVTVLSGGAMANQDLETASGWQYVRGTTHAAKILKPRIGLATRFAENGKAMLRFVGCELERTPREIHGKIESDAMSWPQRHLIQRRLERNGCGDIQNMHGGYAKRLANNINRTLQLLQMIRKRPLSFCLIAP